MEVCNVCRMVALVKIESVPFYGGERANGMEARKRTKGGLGMLEYSVSCGMATQVLAQWPGGTAAARPASATRWRSVRCMVESGGWLL